MALPGLGPRWEVLSFIFQAERAPRLVGFNLPAIHPREGESDVTNRLCSTLICKCICRCGVHAALQHPVGTVLFRQPLADQPFLNDLGDLQIVLVLHHHVAVALDADLGEVDPID